MPDLGISADTFYVAISQITGGILAAVLAVIQSFSRHQQKAALQQDIALAEMMRRSRVERLADLRKLHEDGTLEGVTIQFGFSSKDTRYGELSREGWIIRAIEEDISRRFEKLYRHRIIWRYTPLFLNPKSSSVIVHGIAALICGAVFIAAAAVLLWSLKDSAAFPLWAPALASFSALMAFWATRRTLLLILGTRRDIEFVGAENEAVDFSLQEFASEAEQSDAKYREGDISENYAPLASHQRPS